MSKVAIITLYGLGVFFLFAVTATPRLMLQGDIDVLHAPTSNGDLSFTTSDSYVFGTVIQKKVFELHQDNKNIHDWANHGWIVDLPVFLIQHLRLPFEATCFYIPILFSLLVTAGVFFCGREFDHNLCCRWLAVSWTSVSFYFLKRSAPGYFDTDALALGWPLLSCAAFCWSFKYRGFVTMMMALVAFGLYPQAYQKGAPLGVACLLCCSLAALASRQTWTAMGLLTSAAILPLAFQNHLWYGAVGLICFLTIYFSEKKIPDVPIWIWTLASLFGLFGIWFSGMLDRIWLYLGHSHSELLSAKHLQQQNFVYDFSTGAESVPIGLEALAQNSMGSVILFGCACFGGLLLIFRSQKGFVLLPFWGIGFFSLWGGGRFALYITPAVMLGLAELFQLIYERHQKKVWVNLILTTLGLGLIYWMLQASLTQPKGPYVSAPQVSALKSIRPHRVGDGTIFGWWDDSYSTTFISHQPSAMPFNSFGGEWNYWMSQILLSKDDHLPEHVSRFLSSRRNIHALSAASLKFGQDTLLNKPKFWPKADGERWLYLPLQLGFKAGAIQKFSKLKRETNRLSTFIPMLFKDKGSTWITMSNNYLLNRKSMELKNPEGVTVPIGRAHLVHYDSHGRAKVLSTQFKQRVKTDLILIGRQSAILMEREIFDSRLIQMGILHQYADTVYEPVHLGPDLALYRWKREGEP